MLARGGEEDCPTPAPASLVIDHEGLQHADSVPHCQDPGASRTRTAA